MPTTWKPIAVFFALTILLLALIPILSALTGATMDFDAGGSLIPAIMVHGLTNDAVGLSGLANLNTALTPYHQVTRCLPFLILSVVLIALSGRQLGRAAPPVPPK